jgi:cold shock protein
MATGTVKWFNPDKGFGFIQPQDGGKDVFVHITAVQAAGLQSLNENQKVTYEVVTERGKQAAANLRVCTRINPSYCGWVCATSRRERMEIMAIQMCAAKRSGARS